MAEITLVSSIDRTETYPVTKAVSAPHNCGTFCFKVNEEITEQMIAELPAINIKIYTNGTIAYEFNLNMDTFNSDAVPTSCATDYSVQVLNVPSSFIVRITPVFDDLAIQSHNEMVENGIVESLETTNRGIVSNDTSAYLWDEQTQEFPITMTFNNANIQAGGGSGGGGGSDQASDIQYDNSGSGLNATNVQDAIDELQANQTTITTTTETVTLLAASWVDDTYTIENSAIKTNSIINISTPSSITEEQYDAISNANIICLSQSNGRVVLKAVKDVPEIDVPVVVSIQNIT